MKLNHECVRDLLLSIEQSETQNYLFLRHLKEMPLLSSYSDEEIIYTASKLREKNFIIAKQLTGDGKIFDIAISEMTWDGHEFLDNIRDNQVWKATKEISSKITGASLSILADVAKSYISKTLGL